MSDDEKFTAEDIQDLKRSLDTIKTERRASTSLLQRRLRMGYATAAKMIAVLEDCGIIGPGDGANPREILADLDDADIEKMLPSEGDPIPAAAIPSPLEPLEPSEPEAETEAEKPEAEAKAPRKVLTKRNGVIAGSLAALALVGVTAAVKLLPSSDIEGDIKSPPAKTAAADPSAEAEKAKAEAEAKAKAEADAKAEALKNKLEAVNEKGAELKTPFTEAETARDAAFEALKKTPEPAKTELLRTLDKALNKQDIATKNAARAKAVLDSAPTLENADAAITALDALKATSEETKSTAENTIKRAEEAIKAAAAATPPAEPDDATPPPAEPDDATPPAPTETEKEAAKLAAEQAEKLAEQEKAIKDLKEKLEEAAKPDAKQAEELAKQRQDIEDLKKKLEEAAKKPTAPTAPPPAKPKTPTAPPTAPTKPRTPTPTRTVNRVLVSQAVNTIKSKTAAPAEGEERRTGRVALTLIGTGDTIFISRVSHLFAKTEAEIVTELKRAGNAIASPKAVFSILEDENETDAQKEAQARENNPHADNGKAIIIPVRYLQDADENTLKAIAKQVAKVRADIQSLPPAGLDKDFRILYTIHVIDGKVITMRDAGNFGDDDNPGGPNWDHEHVGLPTIIEGGAAQTPANDGKPRDITLPAPGL